jgi:hypothetical protein
LVFEPEARAGWATLLDDAFGFAVWADAFFGWPSDADDPAIDEHASFNPNQIGIFAVMMAEDESGELGEIVGIWLGINWEVPMFFEDALGFTKIVFDILNELLGWSHGIFPTFRRKDAWTD